MGRSGGMDDSAGLPRLGRSKSVGRCVRVADIGSSEKSLKECADIY